MSIYEHQQQASFRLISKRSDSNFSTSSWKRSINEQIKPAALLSYSTNSTVSPRKSFKKEKGEFFFFTLTKYSFVKSFVKSVNTEECAHHWFWCLPGQTSSEPPSWAALFPVGAGSCACHCRWLWNTCHRDPYLLPHLLLIWTPMGRSHICNFFDLTLNWNINFKEIFEINLSLTWVSSDIFIVFILGPIHIYLSHAFKMNLKVSNTGCALHYVNKM